MKNFIRFFSRYKKLFGLFNIPKDSREVTVIFKNMQTLKFKSHLYKMNALFATINHNKIKIQSQAMNPETAKCTKTD